MIQEWNHDPASAEIIFTISEWFSTPSMSTILHSYASREFQDFLTKWFVTWKPSSPYFAQSNVLAESSVIFEIFIVETRCSEYEVVGIQDFIVWVSLQTEGRRTKPEHFRVWSSVATMFGYTPYGVWIILDQGYGARRCLESRQKRPKSTTTLLLLISRLFHWDRCNWPKREYKILFPSGCTSWQNRRHIRPLHENDME